MCALFHSIWIDINWLYRLSFSSSIATSQQRSTLDLVIKPSCTATLHDFQVPESLVIIWIPTSPSSLYLPPSSPSSLGTCVVRRNRDRKIDFRCSIVYYFAEKGLYRGFTEPFDSFTDFFGCTLQVSDFLLISSLSNSHLTWEFSSYDKIRVKLNMRWHL